MKDATTFFSPVKVTLLYMLIEKVVEVLKVRSAGMCTEK